MEKRISKYFLNLRKSYPYDLVYSRLYYKYITILESISDELIEADALPKDFITETDALIIPIIASYKSQFNEIMTTSYYDSFIDAAKEIRTYFRYVKDIWKMRNYTISYDALPVEDAAKYAEQNAAKLITKIDEVTRERIRNTIAKSIKNRETLAQLEKTIFDEFTDMSKARAKLIARTETAKAIEHGGFNEAKALGLQEKSIILGPNPCIICVGNESRGWIPIDQSFDEGDYPSFHPNCVCCTIYRYVKK